MWTCTTHPLGSVRIICDASMTETVTDWSRVRSPSRALRRLRSGRRRFLPQITVPRLDAFQTPFGFVMHPEVARRLSEATRHD